MKILFVCTGNTCRSPMAAGILKKFLHDRKINDVEVLSAGVSADNKSKASLNAIKVCKDIGVDLDTHISRNISDVDIDGVDKFFVMTNFHKSALINLGVDENKIYVLGNQISDPFGGDEKVYINCRDQLCDVLANIIEDLKLVGDLSD